MLETIEIKQYRKLKDITLNFGKGINVISGSNGTCKSSLLYIISNSFKKITKGSLKNEESISVISNINKLMNPKIESLTRGDEKYNDPAPNVKGELYKCKYFDNDMELGFRRQNSGKNKEKKRFSIKPEYKKGNNEKLPAIPVIYLGLFRLFSYGEFLNDKEIKKITKTLPEKYLSIVAKIYKNFTNMEILFDEENNYHGINMGGIKKRGNFSTTYDGIDSNTISSGEDNLYIILIALVSLRYYFEIENKSSILLIDELDATLHPSYQIKLYRLMKEYSSNYEIQIFFTSHSLSLIEYVLEDEEYKNDSKVFYFLENPNVRLMEDVSINKIEMWLKNQSRIENNKKIPVYTEDNEAREFLKLLFKYLKKHYIVTDVFKYFHLVEINFSSEILKKLFKYKKVNISPINTGSICILDGDQQEQKALSYHMTFLPSDELKSPENLIFDYSIKLYNEGNEDFWNQDEVVNSGFTTDYFNKNIKSEIEKNRNKIEELKNKDESTHGKEREFNKKLFNSKLEFFRLVIEHWIENNEKEVHKFYENLKTLFIKVSSYHKIDLSLWKEKE